MKILYPSSPFSARKPDEQYADEMRAVQAKGLEVLLFSLEALQAGEFVCSDTPCEHEETLYRGWMLSPKDYSFLEQSIVACGSSMFTSLPLYLASHHLPNWYPLLKDFTPETVILPEDADLKKELAALNWEAFFIKDYVKSLKTSVGSIVHDPGEISAVVSEMKKFRGTIEGGFCIRRLESFRPETETRYFVFNGVPFAPDCPIPEIVVTCAKLLPSRFFSVDVIERTDGELRVVEVGDGQVSDLVGWTPDQFAHILRNDRSDA